MANNIADLKVILGSKSPRRSQLLKEAGFNVEIRIQDVDESFDPAMPVLDVALYLAKRKGEALLATLQREEILVTADSVVILDDQIYNKPETFDEGVRILSKLSDRTHLVATGVSISTVDLNQSFTVLTKVTFAPLSLSEIHYYLTNYSPYDKAGSYGIQDWIGLCKVVKIEGSYSNIMGLPMHEVYTTIQAMVKK